MRIQHNIMAMNAYRNYSNNTSALSKNLERLSSGYKINRAGDDAAGLAISEKMRAQITGLDAAQKNVKDGISLVNTAEGAMQEIQDMLNRMVYLANQSANGTYDDPVDRANLQKEVESLKSEIDRIADSANFNGINLLDGSKDMNGDQTTKVDFKALTAGATAGAGSLPTVGTVLGTNTVLHNNETSTTGTEFSVDLHNVAFSNKQGEKLTIEVGSGTNGFKVELEALANGTELDGAGIAAAIKAGTNSNYKVTITGGDGNAAATVSDAFKVSGQDVKLDSQSGYRLTFKQQTAPTQVSEEINGSMAVNITKTDAAGQAVAGVTKFEFTLDPATITAGQVLTVGTATRVWSAADAAADFADVLEDMVGTDYEVAVDATSKKVTLTGKTYNASATMAVGVSDRADQVVNAANGAGPGGVTAGETTTAMTGTVAVGDEVVIKIGNQFFDAFDVAALGQAGPPAVPASVTLEIGGVAQTGITAEIDDSGKIVVKDANAVYGNDTVTVFYDGAAAGESLGGLNGTAGTPAKAEYDLSGWTSGTLTITDKDATPAVTNPVSIAWDTDLATSIANAEADLASLGITATLTGNTVTFSFDNSAAAPAALDVRYRNNATVDVENKGTTAVTPSTPGSSSPVDYNKSTTDINQVTAAGAPRLASTKFTLTKEMVEDGAKLRIGDDEYTFTTTQGADKGVYIGDVKDLGNITNDELNLIAKRLTDAAADNAVYTVGNGTGSEITLTETTAHGALYTNTDGSSTDNWDLRTVDGEKGIEASLGYTGVTKSSSMGLSLQIGDTSDSFNQLNVSIGDMHVKALGIKDINIGSQKGAQDAVSIIKDAINYVSSVRGDLGAISNRLDHTANNLSVMKENITDAESTIRDTDIAEEMMAYTKNNILVQSAQAMLAQANQVPQGVLQLLQ